MDETWRLFIAFELDETLRQELSRLERALRDALASSVVRWVEPKNIHLTLKFLGNIERGRVPVLTRALERAASGIAPLQLNAQGLGAFPSFQRPNNIWVGLDGNVTETALLARRIEDECERESCLHDERALALHLTIARLKREASNAERLAVGKTLLATPKRVYGTLAADAVSLIASDLRPAGPVYRTLARIPLSG